MSQTTAKSKKLRWIASFCRSGLSRALFGLLILFAVHYSPYTAAAQRRPDYTRWVNPFIGTGGHGHTFPGATTPFGMVQLSPDTRGADWDGSSGYHYSDNVIYGFSHIHLSGTGIPDYCDILFMPTTGEHGQFNAVVNGRGPEWYASNFSRANEHAEPGYYSVRLDKWNVLAELTATPRVGLHRYTFRQGGEANIILDLLWRDKVLGSEIKDVSTTRLEGYRRSSSWAKDQTVYFVAEFSKPYVRTIGQGRQFPDVDTTNSQRIYKFRAKPGEQILVKVALSPVSIEGARNNLAAEMPGWDFDKVRADAKAAWNKELSKIEVSGGTNAQTTTFYTALYHTMIQPNIFEDVDGSYRGHDGKIHNIADDGVSGPSVSSPHVSKGQSGSRVNVKPPATTGGSDLSHEYTVFSLWDTFRAAHPLYTIIDQRRTVDFINAFIRQYEQGGRLPVWELAGNETDTMIGYHAVSVIADAMAKGIKGFDYEKAYEAAKHSAELDREGLPAYKRRGYISMEDDNESVSKTLEYAYDDSCIAQMALRLGVPLIGSTDPAAQAKEKMYAADMQEFWARSQSYQNLFDPSTGFMRPKKNGGFISPFAPNEVTFNYTEGNAWVYSFFVPQDIGSLVRLQGGKKAFAKKLDALFTTTDKLAGREQPDITGLIGQYAHGNEPSHLIAYLYDFTDEPWKTQKYVRQIMDEFYKPAPDGLIGNEDCGQMSAWYVLSASGFYPDPPFPLYLLGTPLFKEVRYHLGNGKTFTVRAPNVSAANRYIRSASLNGKHLDEPAISHDDVMKGGTLDFTMSPMPVTDAFKPATYGDEPGQFIAVPVIGDGRRAFRGSLTFSMQSITPDTQIVYTLDGSEPTPESTLYRGPVTVGSTANVKAAAYNEDGLRSQTAEAIYNLIPNDWSVKIDSKYNRQYTGGGDEGLIDGLRGTTSFASGEWQGYQGQDFVATIDLKRDTTVSEVGGGFLQNAGSWIWMPTHVELEVSEDGSNFTRVADIKTDVAVDDMRDTIRDYTQKISPLTARFVRVHAYNLGKIPSWHPGAGNDAFIFVDEIWAR